jgi:hypothetical protein
LCGEVTQVLVLPSTAAGCSGIIVEITYSKEATRSSVKNLTKPTVISLLLRFLVLHICHSVSTVIFVLFYIFKNFLLEYRLSAR